MISLYRDLYTNEINFSLSPAATSTAARRGSAGE
jgi:hypothetical protein